MSTRSLTAILVSLVALSERTSADEFDTLSFIQVPVAVKKGQRLHVSVKYNTKFEQCVSGYNLDTKKREIIFNNTHREFPDEITIDNTGDAPLKLNFAATNRSRPYWNASYFRINHSGSDYTEIGIEDGGDSSFTDVVIRIEISATPPVTLRLYQFDNFVKVYSRQSGATDWVLAGETPKGDGSLHLNPFYIDIKEAVAGEVLEIKIEICNVPFGDGRSGPNPYCATYDILKHGKLDGAKVSKSGASEKVEQPQVVDSIQLNLSP